MNKISMCSHGYTNFLYSLCGINFIVSFFQLKLKTIFFYYYYLYYYNYLLCVKKKKKVNNAY